MTRSLHARLRHAACGILIVGLCAPAAAIAAGTGGSGSGGAGLSGGASTNPSSPPPHAQVRPVGGSVSTTGNGVSLTTTATGTLRGVLAFTGTVAGAAPGAPVAIQRGMRGGWRTVARAPLAANGHFSARWRASAGGRIPFRAIVLATAGTARTAARSTTRATAASPALRVVIYSSAVATIYGPGFYGHRTACGEILRPGTIGVASRTLRCGTRVSIEYHGESITVPVIDRGPYANGATWDLTEATATALGDPDTETVGAAVLSLGRGAA